MPQALQHKDEGVLAQATAIGGPDQRKNRLDDFKLLTKLGEGTFSEVLKVKHRGTGEVFAMKRFRKHFQSITEIEGLREIQALRRVNPHKHIIDLVEVIFEPNHGILCLNFELMDCNLYELITKRKQTLNETRVKYYLYQICLGLDFLHSKGIFHRDIKPENILIKEHNVKIADLGSCRGIYSRPPFTEYIATRWYRSPEVLLADGLYSSKMDVWAVGCVLYEIFTKNPLFPGSNELDQIHRIHNVFGTPNQVLLEKLVGSSKIPAKFQFPKKEGTGLAHLLPKISNEFMDMLKQLLKYDPDTRITAGDALKHNFLKDANRIRITHSTENIVEELAEKASPSQQPPVATDNITAKKREKHKKGEPMVMEEATGTTYLKLNIYKDEEVEEEVPVEAAPKAAAIVNAEPDNAPMQPAKAQQIAPKGIEFPDVDEVKGYRTAPAKHAAPTSSIKQKAHVLENKKGSDNEPLKETQAKPSQQEEASHKENSNEPQSLPPAVAQNSIQPEVKREVKSTVHGEAQGEAPSKPAEPAANAAKNPVPIEPVAPVSKVDPIAQSLDKPVARNAEPAAAPVLDVQGPEHLPPVSTTQVAEAPGPKSTMGHAASNAAKSETTNPENTTTQPPQQQSKEPLRQSLKHQDPPISNISPKHLQASTSLTSNVHKPAGGAVTFSIDSILNESESHTPDSPPLHSQFRENVELNRKAAVKEMQQRRQRHLQEQMTSLPPVRAQKGEAAKGTVLGAAARVPRRRRKDTSRVESLLGHGDPHRRALEEAKRRRGTKAPIFRHYDEQPVKVAGKYPHIGQEDKYFEDSEILPSETNWEQASLGGLGVLGRNTQIEKLPSLKFVPKVERIPYKHPKHQTEISLPPIANQQKVKEAPIIGILGSTMGLPHLPRK